MKFIQNIDYLASINSEESIRPYLDQIIKRFEEDTIKLEKLHNGKNIFSFRLNRQKRVICTFLDKQSQVILIICEILETHQYHRCKYLYCDVDFSKYNIVGITKLVSTGSADKSYLQLPRIASTRLGNKTVLLSDQQLKLIENHQNNSIFTVIGTAGSGKTTLAQLIFSEKSIENNVLYLTKSKKLLSAIKKDYKSINTEVVKPYRAEFKSYESLSSRMIFQKIFEEDNFKSYNKYLSKTIKTTANNETNNPTYEAVQAILQKDKTILQSNIEYNQLNQYIDNKIYYEVKFSEWLKSQKLYNEIKKDNVTIREIYEDIRKLHDAKYCQGDVIGKKTCVNHSRSNEILGLYKDFLKKTFSIDFTLMDLQIGSQSEVLYDYIVVDEAQDFGKSELQYILSFLNKRGNVYFFIDNNQSLLDDFNLTFRYIKELNIQLNKSLHSYQLTVGYRTPENITKLANNILTIKQSVLNGSLSKNTQSSIQSINDNVSEGDVRFLDATESQQSIAHLQAESKISINIVILVPEDSMRIDAVQLFPQGIIMTPEEIKGLEFDKIVLVNFLNKSSINQLTINQLKSINQHQNNHFPKELCPSTLKHNLFFTKLFVSVTRSMYSVYFIQTKKDNISVKLQSLFKETISCGTEIKLDASSIEEIMEFITEKKDNFSLKQLLDYCQIAYNRIAASELNDETFEKLNELRAILNIVIVDIEEEPQRSGLTDLQQKIDDSLCQHNTSQPNSLDYQFIGDQNRAHIYSPVADCQQSDENSNFYLRTPPLKPIHEQLSPIPLKCRFSKSRKIISTKNATASASQSIPQKPLLAQTDLQQQDEQLSLTTLQSRDFNINNITSSQLEQIIKDKTVLCFLLNTRIDLINGLNNNDLTDFTTKITSQAINTPNKQGNSALYQLTCSSENIAIFEKIINCNEHIINKISQAGIHKIGPFNWSPFFIYIYIKKVKF